MHRCSAEPFAAFDRVTTSRRSFLQTGTAALGGIAACGVLPGVALGNGALRRGKSVVFVYLAGGPSQLDMYDMKPDAPAEIRGEFRPIATGVPGMRICEHLPLHARIADKLAIVNGVETIDTHSDAVVTTGYLRRDERPSFCEVATMIGGQVHHGGTEYTEQLGWHGQAQSARAGVQGSGFRVQEEGWRSNADSVTVEAEDFADPVAQVRHALSLAESGEPAVMVTLAENCLPHGDWDTHGKVQVYSSRSAVRKSFRMNIFQELRAKLPVYDRAIYRLVTDLHRRGLDQDVLVVACGEFGRAPWINRHGGRNHWAPCGSVLFAGGGLRTGQTIGNTGPIGERSTTKPYTAQNVLATIYRHLGIDPAMPIRAADGRTVPLLDEQQVIEELV